MENLPVLLPYSQKLQFTGGVNHLGDKKIILLNHDQPQSLLFSTERIQNKFLCRYGINYETNARNAGFSTASQENLYLPIDPSPDRPHVKDQENDPDSLLNCVRKLAEIRNSYPVLQSSGDFRILYARPGLYPLVYLRSNDHESFIIVVNPSSRNVNAQFSSLSTELPETIFGQEGIFSFHEDQWFVNLPGQTGGIYRVRF